MDYAAESALVSRKALCAELKDIREHDRRGPYSTRSCVYPDAPKAEMISAM